MIYYTIQRKTIKDFVKKNACFFTGRREIKK